MMAEKTKVTVTTSAGHSEQLLQTRRAEREREREKRYQGQSPVWQIFGPHSPLSQGTLTPARRAQSDTRHSKEQIG